MVFKRRNKLTWLRWIAEAFYPRSGWKRAASYVAHRLRRLPDTPHKIARGVGVGVYISFTPFFGMHFFLAVVLAALFRGNVLAALLGTFFGNPISFPLIATGSLTFGRWLLGRDAGTAKHKSILHLFSHAAKDFWFNFKALFTENTADWTNIGEFMAGMFLPYLVGGLLPGVAAGLICYFVSVPIISAYQKRRKGRLMARWKERRLKNGKRADGAK